MAKNNRKRWTAEELANLKKLAKGNTPTRVIGIKLGRSKEAIQAKASKGKISLKPTNQSPYNRRKNNI